METVRNLKIDEVIEVDIIFVDYSQFLPFLIIGQSKIFLPITFFYFCYMHIL
jgi:hypothetical protein